MCTSIARGRTRTTPSWRGVRPRYRNVVVADWATLAAQNPQWFGADGTHLAIDGPGAVALASLVVDHSDQRIGPDGLWCSLVAPPNAGL